MKFSSVLISVLCFGAFFAGNAEARGYGSKGALRSRMGFHFERFKGGGTDSGTQGLMLGFRSSWYVYNGLSLGLELNAGAPTDGSIVDNNLLYAGMILAYDQTFLKIFHYDLSCLVGYGYGRSNSISTVGHSVVVQPMASLGIVIVEGYRLSFGPGYLYMPGANGFNGITFSLRFERKTESQGSKPLDY